MSESKHAKKDGADLQPNSGRGSHAKGDAVLKTPTGLYVVDYKEYSKSFSISTDNWSKLCGDAMAVDWSSEPLFKIVLDEDVEIGALDWSWLMELMHRNV